MDPNSQGGVKWGVTGCSSGLIVGTDPGFTTGRGASTLFNQNCSLSKNSLNLKKN